MEASRDQVSKTEREMKTTSFHQYREKFEQTVERKHPEATPLIGILSYKATFKFQNDVLDFTLHEKMIDLAGQEDYLKGLMDKLPYTLGVWDAAIFLRIPTGLPPVSTPFNDLPMLKINKIKVQPAKNMLDTHWAWEHKCSACPASSGVCRDYAVAQAWKHDCPNARWETKVELALRSRC